ncbi:MAG: alpha/beta fold hydrolase [Deltaproteobacteria bacterium]|nr:alpha/beta fold hydrolase [Deltaproteobacteria bacterium]
MILRTETVEQSVDIDEVVTLEKQVVMTPGREPLGMVRKRLPPPAEPRGTVLLVHGFGQNRYTWHVAGRSFSAYLAREGWDVFNCDLRGHGRSRRFGSQRPRVLEEYIREDVPALASEALRISGDERIFLIGHSMGGIISYGAAATGLRQKTSGIVSIGSPYLFGTGSRTLSAVSAVLNTFRNTGVFDSNPRLPLRLVGRHLHKRRRLWDSRFWLSPIRPWTPGSVEDSVLDDYLSRAFDWSSLEIAFDIFRAGKDGVLAGRHGRSNYRAAFEHLDRPLLVIAGTRDHLAPPESVRPACRGSRSRDKTYRAFPMGHVDLIVGREAPKTVWPTVSEWLARRATYGQVSAG